MALAFRSSQAAVSGEPVLFEDVARPVIQVAFPLLLLISAAGAVAVIVSFSFLDLPRGLALGCGAVVFGVDLAAALMLARGSFRLQVTSKHLVLRNGFVCVPTPLDRLQSVEVSQQVVEGSPRKMLVLVMSDKTQKLFVNNPEALVAAIDRARSKTPSLNR